MQNLAPRLRSTEAVAEQVAEELRERIIKGQLDPGDRIVERQISEELGVSRTPVREALKLLDADGLIEINMHRGAVVSAYRAEDALALFDVIAMLESLSARRVCENMSPPILQKFEDLHGTMLEHYAAGRTNDYFDTNTLIHDAIVAAAENPILKKTHEKLMTRARRGRYLAIMDADRLTQAVSEHETLMEALRGNEPDAAAKIWEMHLRHTGQTVATVLLRDS